VKHRGGGVHAQGFAQKERSGGSVLERIKRNLLFKQAIPRRGPAAVRIAVEEAVRKAPGQRGKKTAILVF